MSDSESMEGSLRETPFAALVGTLYRQGATGVLEIRDALGVNRAFFLNGTPQGATLARLKHPIGRLLVTDGRITEQQLSEALATLNETGQLLGQILLERNVINDTELLEVLAEQSQLNLLSLFGVTDGKFQFKEGLVHLKDFSASPCAVLPTMYEGLRDHASSQSLNEFGASLAFAALRITAEAEQHLTHIDPAEQMALKLLSDYRLSGDIARRLPLAGKAISALLFALKELDQLEIGPAHLVRG